MNEILTSDLSETHGFAMWCLASDPNKEVTYHLDYAEQFRMQTNVIWCPMLATVCNVTPCREGEMIGGEFAANMDGIDHYAKFGHRGRLHGIEELNKNLASNVNWVRVPYVFVGVRALENISRVTPRTTGTDTDRLFCLRVLFLISAQNC